VLALVMLGSVLWAVDRLARLFRTAAPATARAAAPGSPHPADRPVLAPRLAASVKITMGYMLLMML
jgi:hypothetical protein